MLNVDACGAAYPIPRLVSLVPPFLETVCVCGLENRFEMGGGAVCMTKRIDQRVSDRPVNLCTLYLRLGGNVPHGLRFN